MSIWVNCESIFRLALPARVPNELRQPTTLGTSNGQLLLRVTAK